MKQYFKSSLQGKDLWKCVYLAAFAFIALIVVYTLSLAPLAKGQSGTALLILLSGMLVYFLGLAIIVGFFGVWLLQILFSKIQYNMHGFEFTARKGEGVTLVAQVMFLSFITLGIYFPWGTVKVYRFIAKHTHYQSHSFSFNSKGGKLFLYGLCFFVPFIIIYVMTIVQVFTLRGVQSISELQSVFGWFILLLVYALVAGSIYSVYVMVWKINVSFQHRTYTLNINKSKATLFVLGQVLLSIITFAIYLPAAVVFIYRYFVRHMEIKEHDAVVATFGFSGDVWRGFAFYWFYIVTLILTGPFLLPWSYTLLFNYFVDNTYTEPKACSITACSLEDNTVVKQ